MRNWTHSASCRYTFAEFFSSLLENNGSFRVYWNNKEMKEVLSAAAPFMRVQKQQAKVLLEFLSRVGIPEYQSEKIKELNSAKHQHGSKRGTKVE